MNEAVTAMRPFHMVHTTVHHPIMVDHHQHHHMVPTFNQRTDQECMLILMITTMAHHAFRHMVCRMAHRHHITTPTMIGPCGHSPHLMTIDGRTLTMIGGSARRLVRSIIMVVNTQAMDHHHQELVNHHQESTRMIIVVLGPTGVMHLD